MEAAAPTGTMEARKTCVNNARDSVGIVCCERAFPGVCIQAVLVSPSTVK